MSFSDFWSYIKIRKWGKYVITLLVFAIIYLFVGEQSVLHFIHRRREIRRLEQQRDRYRKATDKAQQEILLLQQPDSLEQYAREHYYMHMSDEDIYLVEE
jgi:cell division protein FtsB